MYLTDEAIHWAKTGIAGKIDMTIRLACQAYQQGNEALFLIEERQKRIKDQIATLVKLREEGLRKQVAMQLAVEKYQDAADEMLAVKKTMGTPAPNSSQHYASQYASSSHGSSQVSKDYQSTSRGGAEKYAANRRREIDFTDFYNREAIPPSSGAVPMGASTPSSRTVENVFDMEYAVETPAKTRRRSVSLDLNAQARASQLNLGESFKSFLDDTNLLVRRATGEMHDARAFGGREIPEAESIMSTFEQNSMQGTGVENGQDIEVQDEDADTVSQSLAENTAQYLQEDKLSSCGKKVAERMETHQRSWTERPWQTIAASEVLGGHDTIVTTATGSGKTMCYQGIAISNNGTILVISPILSLMKDQCESNEQVGISSCRLTKSTMRDDRKLVERAANGEYKVVMVGPEFINARDKSFQKLLGIKCKGARRGAKSSKFVEKLTCIVVDEAHLCYTW
ncbi:P-loop containing nucleoside triphosphate hydrolase protein [Kalaharituber pfeilii]|nr:P-loop containing nucleoside triphosphate hydrolase protein [Kalaharituber pfeilii]